MAKEKRQRIQGYIETSTITSGQRSPMAPFESVYKEVMCEDGQMRIWWYDECQVRPCKDDIIEATVNKFGNLCHVKMVSRATDRKLYTNMNV